MSNEAEIINNPDSTPGAVSTGYQAQNTNLVSQRTGIDKTYVSGGVGTVTVEISGPVDVNGVLYDIKSQTVLTPPSAGRYYITLQGAGPQYLTPTLGTSAGTFDPLKNARYDSSGYRILNWVIYFNGTICRVSRLLTPEYERTYLPDINEPEETWITVNSNWIAPRSKYYTIWMTGKGGDGGSATVSGTTYNAKGGHGGGGGTIRKRIFINAGDSWTAIFSSTSGGINTFYNSSTSLSCQNGYNGSSGSNSYGSDGLGGHSATNYDNKFDGGFGGHGGASIYGSNRYDRVSGNNGSGGTVYTYGVGGHGAGFWNAIAQSGNGSTGGPAVIRIIG